ncbi:MAG: hypothetical protein L5655_07930 [Thermosediminibacteraceae bacterium]|nr:hypothetical protein [Thermosediminibacteraceae bacterium]
MYIEKKKLLFTFAVFLLSLFLLLSAQQLYVKFVTFKPLLETFSQKEYVEHVNIKKEVNGTSIEIYLKDVDNLVDIYEDIQKTASTVLKGRPFVVKILNKPDKFIENIYNEEVQFIVFEGIETGEFTKMRLNLDQIEAKYNIEIAVFIDNENLYLKMKTDRSVYYKIIKRD